MLVCMCINTYNLHAFVLISLSVYCDHSTIYCIIMYKGLHTFFKLCQVVGTMH